MHIINTTPHPIRLQSADGTVYEVPPSGVLINARVEEEDMGRHPSGVDLIRTRFVAHPEAIRLLDELEKSHPGALIVGSIIAAQAFPGRLFGLIAVPGFERVAPEKKRMRDDRFVTF